MKILTCEEVRAAEREAEQHGISALDMMEAAGRAVAGFCQAHFQFTSVCVVCGKGNNGGDGLVAASALLAAGKRVSVLVLAQSAKELSGPSACMLSNMPVRPVWISKESDFEANAVQGALQAELMIDAIVGSGFKPPLRDLARRAVQAINDSTAPVVSVDIPSGADADSPRPIMEEEQEVVIADGVITFIAPRAAHVFGDLASGPVAVKELAGLANLFPETSRHRSVATARDLGIVFPPRANQAHKGDFGHVLVLGGSLGKAGAAALAGMAALRAGAGLVTVACPRSVQSTIAGFAAELMTEGLPETPDGTISLEAGKREAGKKEAGKNVDRLLAGKDAIVLGPGLSGNEETAQFIRQFVANCRLPLVLDADGLNAFAGRHKELLSLGGSSPVRVLTPHPGEAARLMDLKTDEIQNDRIETAKRMARETGSIVALKGWRTVVADTTGETWINMTGNPAMAKGGSGDVLAGMIAAGLARHPSRQENKSILEPAEAGGLPLTTQKVASMVYLHGLAGDIARDTYNENTVLATDMMHCFSQAYDHCNRQLASRLFYLRR